MNIQPTYVTFEQAKLLKEKGMIVSCGAYQIEEGNRLIDWRYTPATFKLTPHFLPAPEQWQVVEWLRIKHNIWIEAMKSYGVNGIYKYCIDTSNKFQLVETEYKFKSPQEAYSAAFDYVLKELI